MNFATSVLGVIRQQDLLYRWRQ